MTDGSTPSRPPRSVVRRIRTLGSTGARDLIRDPVLVVLVVLAPLYFVGAWGALVPESAIPIDVATADGTASVVVDFPELITAIVAPVTVALLVGITALFLVQRSRSVDDRLRIVGYRPVELLAARLLLLAVLCLFVATLVTGVGYRYLSPEHLVWFVLGLLLAGGAYGAIGAVVGRLLGRMAGVYVLLFAPLLDIMLLGLPLGDAVEWAVWLPGHHATELVLSAAFADAVATGHLLPAVGVVAGLSVLAAIVTAR